MTDYVRNVRGPTWTKTELDLLREELANNTSIADIASALNRTEGAVKQKAQKILRNGRRDQAFFTILARLDRIEKALTECLRPKDVGPEPLLAVPVNTIHSRLAASEANWTNLASGATYTFVCKPEEYNIVRSYITRVTKKLEINVTCIQTSEGIVIVRR